MGSTDSRTIFRDQIQILVNEDIPQDRYEFWDMLFSIPITLSDVFAMIPDQDILNLLEHKKENFIRVLDYCITILEDFLVSIDSVNTKQSACSNATKILIRIVPFVLVDNDMMWSDQPRAIRLMVSVQKLLFTTAYGITALAKSEISDYSQVDLQRLWGSGFLLTNNNSQVSAVIWNNRHDLLKLLLTLSSFELFHQPQSSQNNLYTLFMISKANLYSSQLFYSLLNIFLSFKPMGYWNLPYSSYFNYEYEEPTIRLALQLISVLYHATNEISENFNLEAFGMTSLDLSENQIKHKLQNISNKEEFGLIYNAFKELMKIITISANTYLPSSVKEIQCKDELILFFWILLKSNSNFKGFLNTQNNLYEIVIPLVKQLDSKEFIIASNSAYILLQLSTIRAFSASLYAEFPNIVTDLPLFTGNYSDFLIIALSKYILNPTNFYLPLNPYFLMIIDNISPFIRNLTPIASSALIRLLEKHSVKVWLLESQNNNYLLFYVLETINNIIQYQWNAAGILILSLIRKKEIVLKLFTIPDRWEEDKEKPEWCSKNWFCEWTSKLPFEVLKGVLYYMIPQLEQFTISNPKADDEKIIDFIKNSSLVGLLPPPPIISVRSLETNKFSEFYEKIYIWSFVYIKSLPLQIVPFEKIQFVQFLRA